MRHRRHPNRRAWRRPFRCGHRPGFRSLWRAPDDLAAAFTAFGHAFRAHRRLARLAPRFFDAAVVDREAQNRAEVRRWVDLWEPALARAYGTKPAPPSVDEDRPPLPPPRTQRAVERHLAAWHFWFPTGAAALDRCKQRRPHLRMDLGRIWISPLRSSGWRSVWIPQTRCPTGSVTNTPSLTSSGLAGICVRRPTRSR